MKVLGIGNAIVDVICKVEESFIAKNNLTKGTMKLVNETEFKKLLSNSKIKEKISCSFAKIISNLLFTKSKKFFLCRFTQNWSDNDIAVFLDMLIALLNAVLGSPSSHK